MSMYHNTNKIYDWCRNLVSALFALQASPKDHQYRNPHGETRLFHLNQCLHLFQMTWTWIWNHPLRPLMLDHNRQHHPIQFYWNSLKRIPTASPLLSACGNSNNNISSRNRERNVARRQMLSNVPVTLLTTNLLLLPLWLDWTWGSSRSSNVPPLRCLHLQISTCRAVTFPFLFWSSKMRNASSESCGMFGPLSWPHFFFAFFKIILWKHNLRSILFVKRLGLT